MGHFRKDPCPTTQRKFPQSREGEEMSEGEGKHVGQKGSTLEKLNINQIMDVGIMDVIIKLWIREGRGLL